MLGSRLVSIEQLGNDKVLIGTYKWALLKG